MEEIAIFNLIKNTLYVAKSRSEILEQLKQALLDKDQKKVEEYAGKLCGLVNDHEDNWIFASIHSGTRSRW